MSPLFFFTDIEYKDPEDHSIAACIYTFPDIIVEDAISEDDLKTEILTNVKQPSPGIKVRLNSQKISKFSISSQDYHFWAEIRKMMI